MAFKLYTDKKMENDAWTLSYNYNSTGSIDTLLYFGSPNPKETLTPAEDEQITLTPVNTATPWEPNQVYSINQIIVIPPVSCFAVLPEEKAAQPSLNGGKLEAALSVERHSYVWVPCSGIQILSLL